MRATVSRRPSPMWPGAVRDRASGLRRAASGSGKPGAPPGTRWASPIPDRTVPASSRRWIAFRRPRPGVLRLPLVHEGERLGVLEATLPTGSDRRRRRARGARRLPRALPRGGRAVGRPGARGGDPVPRDRRAAPLHQPDHRQPSGGALRRRPRVSHPDLEPEAGDRHPGRPPHRRDRPAGVRRAHPPAGGHAPRRVRPRLPDRQPPSRTRSRRRPAARRGGSGSPRSRCGWRATRSPT